MIDCGQHSQKVAGLIENLEYRLPLTAPSLESMKKIEEVMKNYEIKGL